MGDVPIFTKILNTIIQRNIDGDIGNGPNFFTFDQGFKGETGYLRGIGQHLDEVEVGGERDLAALEFLHPVAVE